MAKYVDHTGETKLAKNGHMMTIKAYRHWNDVDIEFDDGVVIEHTYYNTFREGYVKHPRKSKVGETFISRRGQKMTIIKDRGNNQDLDIQFEDGTIVRHKPYFSIKDGDVGNPSLPHANFKAQLHIGETNTARNGLKMTIENYISSTNLSVRFENGILVEHRAYKEFKLGKIGCPGYGKYQKDRHVGETRIASNGQKMTLIKWINHKDITVQFEDGTIVEHVLNNSFRQGTVINPNYTRAHIIAESFVGQTNKAKNGLMMTIIAYRSNLDIDIQFEDGVIVKNKNMNHFRKGNIRHPNINCQFKDRTNEKQTSTDGINMTITDYAGSTDCTIQFETGFVTEHKDYNNFLNGKIGHPYPYQLGTIVMRKPAFVHNNVGNFYCACDRCGMADIMSVAEIKHHRCK